MSLRLTARIQTNRGQVRLHRLGQVSKPRVLNNILKLVASRGLRQLMRATPRGLTGRTKKAWRVVSTEHGYTVTNIHGHIVLFLDEGTRAHGPVRAKFLFIALSKKAALQGWKKGMVFGVDYVLAKRVRGIRALHFVREQADWMRVKVTEAITKYVRDLSKR